MAYKSISLGSYAFGSLTTLGQVDRYEFNIPFDGEYVISVQGADSGSGTLADPYMTYRVWDGWSYSSIASDNDSGTGRDALAVRWAYGGIDSWSAVDVSSYAPTKTGTYVLWIALKDYVLMGATPGNDANVAGTAGNDIIDGLDGADTLKGGAGNDTCYVNQSGDVVVEALGAGTDSVISQVSRTLEANVEKLSLTGSGHLNGSGNTLANEISGNSGNNILNGFAGNDSLSGGSGNDTLNGGTGNDSMSGGGGDDVYHIDSTGDIIANDSYGLDKVFSPISWTLGSGLDNLTLTGTAAINGTGNSLNNYLYGNAATNHLRGNDGNDTLNGGAGADSMDGGAGNDVFYADNAGDKVSDTAGGTDKVYSAVTFTLASGLENLTLSGSAAINATGNAAANILDGSANTAANVLTGAAGNDTYLLGAGDRIVEAAGEGVDAVRAGFSYTLGATLEHLLLSGTGAVNGTGNALNNSLQGNTGANHLWGNGGNDTLNGSAGADSMDGGAGNDVFYADNAGDKVSDTAGGTDKVYSAVTFTLASGLENLTLSGSAAINATGNAAANILDGSANTAANVLTGAAGNDTYLLGAGDSVAEAAGGGTDTVQAGFSYTLGTNQENLSLTGDLNSSGTGNALNNLMRGNTGSNYLAGNDGNDTLMGGSGHDDLTGGHGNDVFVFTALADSDGSGMNYDSIQDFAAGDKIDLHGIDANTALAGDQAFSYITGAFTQVAGQLTVRFGTVQGDVNGDGVADLYITCYTDQMGYGWSSADFIL